MFFMKKVNMLIRPFLWSPKYTFTDDTLVKMKLRVINCLSWHPALRLYNNNNLEQKVS